MQEHRTEAFTRLEQPERESIFLSDRVQDFFNIADEKDILILRQFYFTGREPPFDTEPQCVPILHRKLLELGIAALNVKQETLRKRLDKMVGYGVLGKSMGKNPVSYFPASGESGLAFVKESLRVCAGKREKELRAICR